jgi:UDP-N-acetyl-D-mannosaminuronate dehydrogenase
LANNEFPLLQSATEKMWERPANVAQRILATLKSRTESPRVLVVGVAFKKGQSSTVNSPSTGLIHSLQELGTLVNFVDPLVSQDVLPLVPRLDETKEWTKKHLEANFDYIIIAVKQNDLDYAILENISVPIESYVH